MKSNKFGLSLLAATCMLVGCQAVPVATVATTTQPSAAGTHHISLRLLAPARRQVLETVAPYGEGAIAHYRCRLAVPSGDTYTDKATQTVGTEGLVTFDHLQPIAYRVFVEGINEEGEVVTAPAFIDYTLSELTGELNPEAKTVQLTYKNRVFSGEFALPFTYGDDNARTFIPPWATAFSYELKVDDQVLKSGSFDPAQQNVLKNLKVDVTYTLSTTATGGGLSWTDTKQLQWDSNDSPLSTTNPSYELTENPNGTSSKGEFNPNFDGGDDGTVHCAATQDGGAWITGETAGVTEVKRIDSTMAATAPFTFPGTVRAVLPEGTTALWVVGSANGQMTLYHVPTTGAATTIPLGAVAGSKPPGFYSNNEYSTIVSDLAGGVWVTAFNGVYKVKADKTLDTGVTTAANAGIAPSTGVAEAVTDNHGGLWAVYDTEFWLIGADGTVSRPKNADMSNFTGFTFAVTEGGGGLSPDGQGGLWVGSRNIDGAMTWGAYHLSAPAAGTNVVTKTDTIPNFNQVIAGSPNDVFLLNSGIRISHYKAGGLTELVAGDDQMRSDGAGGVWFRVENNVKWAHYAAGADAADVFVTDNAANQRSASFVATPTRLWAQRTSYGDRFYMYTLDPAGP